MLERTIEQYLVKRVKELGGLCLKLGGYKGIPDRMILLPYGKILFLEVKKEGGRVSPEQEKWIERLTELGYTAKVVFSKNDVKGILDGELCEDVRQVNCEQEGEPRYWVC